MPVGFVCEIWTKKIPEAGLNSPVPSSVNKKYFFFKLWSIFFLLFKLCVTTEDPRKSKAIIF